MLRNLINWNFNSIYLRFFIFPPFRKMLTKGALEPSDGPALNEEQRQKLRQLKVDTQKRDEAYIRVSFDELLKRALLTENCFNPSISIFPFRSIQNWTKCAPNSCATFRTSDQLTRPPSPRPGSPTKISNRTSRRRCKRKSQIATSNSSKTFQTWNYNFYELYFLPQNNIFF